MWVGGGVGLSFLLFFLLSVGMCVCVCPTATSTSISSSSSRSICVCVSVCVCMCVCDVGKIEGLVYVHEIFDLPLLSVYVKVTHEVDVEDGGEGLCVYVYVSDCVLLGLAGGAEVLVVALEELGGEVGGEAGGDGAGFDCGCGCMCVCVCVCVGKVCVRWMVCGLQAACSPSLLSLFVCMCVCIILLPPPPPLSKYSSSSSNVSSLTDSFLQA